MAVDLQVCFPQETIELTAVRPVPGATSPRKLDLIGRDFRSVDEVLINEIPSPVVVIVSKTRLRVDVPTSIGNGPILSINVTSRQLTITPKSLIKFRIGHTPSKVSGILRLLQVYLKVLITTPGTDILSQRTGADALKNVGRTFGKSQSASIVSDFVLANTVAVRQIIAIQSRDPSLPRDERLLSSRVISAQYSQQEAALLVSTEIASQAGRSAVANVMV